MPKVNAKKTKLGLNRYGFFALVLALATGVTAVLYVTLQPKPSTQSTTQCNGLELTTKCITLERATTTEAQVKGLSNRDSLAKDNGVLFVFDRPDGQCFWMKDMRFDIDMVFIDSTKKVVKIDSAVSPATYPKTFCADNVQYVIELNSSDAQKYTIEVGQQLKF